MWLVVLLVVQMVCICGRKRVCCLEGVCSAKAALKIKGRSMCACNDKDCCGRNCMSLYNIDVLILILNDA
jgi:hypothetical protein